MESLAGQSEQSYFTHDFSPDFSGHAPAAFNTATDTDRFYFDDTRSTADKKYILDRYAHNPVNSLVMNTVGKRFAQIMKSALKIKSINAHSKVGPHPFIISIEELAAFEGSGQAVANLKRPWRLVFEPALDNISEAGRLNTIQSNAAYIPGHPETDFRYKLAHLQRGDRVFYVVGQSEQGTRYRLGEIRMDSSPFPSIFEDREFFVFHKMEMGRTLANKNTIVSPSY